MSDPIIKERKDEAGKTSLATRLATYFRRFSFVGLGAATLFFAASVTPSLLPRHFAVQGILSGMALAVGYGVGVACVWIYHFLEFADPSEKVQLIGKRLTTVIVAMVSLVSLATMTEWQNSVRERMEMPEVQSAYPMQVVLIAVVVGIFLVALTRLVAACGVHMAISFNRVVPRRLSLLLSTVLVAILLMVIGEGIIARGLLAAADRVFLYADGLIDEDMAQPIAADSCGSQESLIDWQSIGRYGKSFIADGPTEDEITAVSQRDALRPIRVYAGLRSADDNRERAELALEELKRVGGFERSTLVIATPTGTGWLDPGGVDTVEYLLAGDSAIVSMQYSYLPSWMTILVDPRRSIDSARALFDVVYEHWSRLPADNRPKLYLHGLSLGALGSESSADLVTLLDDPIQGGVFSGTPFPSQRRANLTSRRNDDSPEWLPTFRDGRMVRFTNQFSPPDPAKPWGKMRFVYIQYASDPMVFFSPSMFYRRPEWMSGTRGPDVSPELRWFPLVSFLQVGFDLPMATSIPIGYGHNYAADDYIDAWVAVAEPAGWSQDAIKRLKTRLAPGDDLDWRAEGQSRVAGDYSTN